ncbi:MAG: DHH family phosphoesterase [Thermoplasmata archaeon]
MKKNIEESKSIRILAHYDVDGVSAAAIIFNTFKGKDFHISFVKNLSKENIKNFLEEKKDFYLFLDMGSSLISYLEGKANCAVLDHHPPEKDSENIIHINPNFCGYSGSKDACGSTLAFLFSIYINEKNIELYPLYLSGVIGDKQNIGGYSGLNLELVNILKNNVPVKSTLKTQGKNIFEALLYSTEPFIEGFSGKQDNVLNILKRIGIDSNSNFDSLDDEKKTKLLSWIALNLLKRNVEKEIIESVLVESFNIGKFNDTFLSEIVDACARQEKQGLALAYLIGDKSRESEIIQIYVEYKKKLINEIYNAIQNTKNLKNLQYFFVSEDSMAGAVASSLMLYYLDRKKVTVAFHEKDSELRVSGRATRKLVENGIDLGKNFKFCAEKFNGYGGGHDIAAGANISKEKFEDFLKCLDENLGANNDNT